MKTIEVVKTKEQQFLYGDSDSLITITTILVDGVKILELRPIKKAIKEGFDSRVKFTVHNFSNELGLKFIYRGARTIKQVIDEINFQLK